MIKKKREHFHVWFVCNMSHKEQQYHLCQWLDSSRELREGGRELSSKTSGVFGVKALISHPVKNRLLGAPVSVILSCFPMTTYSSIPMFAFTGEHRVYQHQGLWRRLLSIPE